MDWFHEEQKKIWEQEHLFPHVLLPMDKTTCSFGIEKAWLWIQENYKGHGQKGLEMGCGKGRNCIYLSEKGLEMTGFDFSKNAILEAKKRAFQKNINISFLEQDATFPWLFCDNTFDVGFDCFASTDISSSEGRQFAQAEFLRVLKPKGLLFIYTLSVDDEFHKKMTILYPSKEKNSFLHPQTGKFEKIFDEQEIQSLYEKFRILEIQRIPSVVNFFGENYRCNHFWIVLENNK